MKKTLFLTLIFSALTSLGYARGADTTKPDKDAKEHTKPATPASDTKSAPKGDDTVIYLGTNEFYLALEREGVLKA